MFQRRIVCKKYPPRPSRHSTAPNSTRQNCTSVLYYRFCWPMTKWCSTQLCTRHWGLSIMTPTSWKITNLFLISKKLRWVYFMSILRIKQEFEIKRNCKFWGRFILDHSILRENIFFLMSYRWDYPKLTLFRSSGPFYEFISSSLDSIT